MSDGKCLKFTDPQQGLLLLLIIALTAGSAWLWTEALLYAQNTLLRNGRWLSTKMTLGMGVMGSDSFLLTRPALHRDRLNLEAWHGCNEVLWRRPLRPRAVSFSFRLAPGAELSAVFDQTANGFSGLRLRADPPSEGTLFRAAPDGGFTSTQSLVLPALAGGWHRMTLGFDAGRLRVGIDGREAGTFAQTLSGEGRVGFRSGFGKTSVDDVVIEDQDGLVEAEDFRNREGGRRTLLINAAGLLLLGGLAAGLASLRGRAWAWTAPRLAAAHVVLAAVGGSFFIFDYLHWSRLHLDPLSRPLSGPEQSPLAQSVESARYKLFSTWPGLAGPRRVGPKELLYQGYPGKRIGAGPVFCESRAGSPPRRLRPDELEALLSRPKSAFRLLFVGSSQTIGAGARKLPETFFARTHRSLTGTFGSTLAIESLNTAVRGENAATSLAAYRDTCLRFQPDLVVINYSINGTLRQLSSGLAGHLRANRERGIPAILIKEAMARRAPLPRLFKAEPLAMKHAALDALAREYGVPVYDLNSHMNAPRIDETGFLWWDAAHLTSHGQAVVARWLTPILARHIRGSRRRSP